MKELNICYGLYAAKWGLTDFYEESEDLLEEAINSGEDFEVSYGCQKEIKYASIKRDSSGVHISATVYMDDLYGDDNDLVYDALWERLRSEEVLSEDVIEEILEEASFFGIDSSSTISEYLPRDAGLKEIYEAIEWCENEAEKNNDEMFNRLCNIVEACYEKIESEENAE